MTEVTEPTQGLPCDVQIISDRNSFLPKRKDLKYVQILLTEHTYLVTGDTMLAECLRRRSGLGVADAGGWLISRNPVWPEPRGYLDDVVDGHIHMVDP